MTAITPRCEIKARNVMEDDHLSPVIGSVFTEILGLPLNRPDALVASFERATAAQDDRAGLNLCAPFMNHWQPSSSAPALALNTTWVEMGFPVAFAPFALNDLDESLYSFVDQKMPKLDNISLMQAAGASARFPLVMPPFSAVMSEGKKRWNFVDGGYSDNSGSTTAMSMYNAVKNVATQQQVDLRLILITSSTPRPDLEGDAISGTVFADTVAPLDALMKVRQNLANNAVARACTVFYPDDPLRQRGPGSTARRGGESNEDCLLHAGGKASILNIVEIQDQTYGLSLGWKISKTSFEVVSWMLGRADSCPSRDEQSTIVSRGHKPDVPSTQNNPNAQISINILERNSCVMKTIVELVNGSLQIPPPAPKNPAR